MLFNQIWLCYLATIGFMLLEAVPNVGCARLVQDVLNHLVFQLLGSSMPISTLLCDISLSHTLLPIHIRDSR